jgi:hypothetical protein
MQRPTEVHLEKIEMIVPEMVIVMEFKGDDDPRVLAPGSHGRDFRV